MTGARLEDLDIRCGLVEVGDTLAFHLEGPVTHEVTRTGRFIWALGASWDGVRVAIPARDGSWAGKGAPLAEDGMLRLMGNLSRSRPRDGDVLRALQEAGLSGKAKGLAQRLVAAARRKGRPPEGLSEALGAAGLDAVLERLGETRIRLYRLGVGIHRLPEEPVVGVMCLPQASVEALERFVEDRPELARIALLTPSQELPGDMEEGARRLLAHYDLPTAILSRLGEATPTLGTEHVRLMAAVPVDWLPQRGDRDGWNDFGVAANLLDALPDACDDRALLAHAKGRWSGFLDTLSRAAGVEREDLFNSRRRLKAALVDLRDTFERFRAEIVLPALGRRYLDEGHREAIALSVTLLQGKRGLARMLEMSRAQHASEIPALGDDDYAEWPPHLPDWTDPATGIDIRSLSNSAELVAEGLKGPDPAGVEGLGHCVGNVAFADACLIGNIRILTLRKEGKRLSTAEVGLSPDLPVAQHRGSRNGLAPPEAEAALAAYLSREGTRLAASAPAPALSPLTVSRWALDEKGLREEAAKALERWRKHLAPEHSWVDVEAIQDLMEGR